jgi:hypothetical protein
MTRDRTPMKALKRLIARSLISYTSATKHLEKPFERKDLFEEIISDEILTIPLAENAKYLKAPRYTTPTIYTGVISSALYYSYLNNVFTKSRRIICECDNTFGKVSEKVPSQIFYWRDVYLMRPRTIDGYAAPLRSSANNYYHSLIDTIPRAYLLNSETFRNLEIKLLVPGSLRKWESYYLPKVLPTNVRIITVDKDTLYKIEKLAFCSFMSRPFAGYLPTKYLEFFTTRCAPSRPRDKKHRIFISRKQALGGRRLRNEQEVQNLLHRHGFRSFVLEELDIPDQIDLFFDAEAVVAPHGAGLANIIFSHKIKVIELHPTSKVYPHYYFLCKALGHRYGYVLGGASSKVDDFFVNTAELASELSVANLV